MSILSTAVLVKAPSRTGPLMRSTISGMTLVLPVPGGPQMRWNTSQFTARSMASCWVKLRERRLKPATTFGDKTFSANIFLANAFTDNAFSANAFSANAFGDNAFGDGAFPADI